ncbi:MAG: hypothetical protein HW416_3008 [Chloroflexi bacterium]|nr:hypothetical protein [Chloroflexota bacterium]
MAFAENFSHSGIGCSSDVREGEAFYVDTLNAQPHSWIGLNVDDLMHARGPHPCVIAGDFLFVTFPQAGPARDRSGERPRGIGGARHAFAVPKERFPQFVDRLRELETDFEGPVAHPESGPLGESVYFTDPVGNHFEVCWRRDEDHQYHPVIVGGD